MFVNYFSVRITIEVIKNRESNAGFPLEIKQQRLLLYDTLKMLRIFLSHRLFNVSTSKVYHFL